MNQSRSVERRAIAHRPYISADCTSPRHLQPPRCTILGCTHVGLPGRNYGAEEPRIGPCRAHSYIHIYIHFPLFATHRSRPSMITYLDVWLVFAKHRTGANETDHPQT